MNNKKNLEKFNPYIGKNEEHSNNFIHRGYRINFFKKRHILKSLFMLHNETTNIWTHLIGCIVVLLLALYTALEL